MIEFIGPLYNWLQQFTNHYLLMGTLDFWPHYTNPLLHYSTTTLLHYSTAELNWTELNWTDPSVILGISLHSLGADHSTEHTFIA
jgi:hypothetical protein